MSENTHSEEPLTVALLLESDGPGGAEVVVLEMARELARRGHRVIAIGPAVGNGWLGARLAESGIAQQVFTKHQPWNPQWIVDLRRMLKALQVDVVHAHEFSMVVYGTAAARTLGIPIINTFHGAEKMTRALRRRVALRWALSAANANFTVSHATKSQLDADLGVSDTSIGVVWNGVPVRVGDRASTRTALGIAPGEHLILAVGTLEPRKGHRILIEALARIPDSENSRWHLAIACGRGGPEKEPIEVLARSLGVEERIKLLTYRNDIPDLLAAADVFAMPSLWEGLPLALLEAMVAGKPIIASRTSGIPEAIDDGRTGILVEPGDTDSLSAALRRVMEDSSYREQLATGARDSALSSFTVDVMVDEYLKAYRAGLARA